MFRQPLRDRLVLATLDAARSAKRLARRMARYMRSMRR